MVGERRIGGLLGFFALAWLSACSLEPPIRWFAPDGASSFVLVEFGDLGTKAEALTPVISRSYDPSSVQEVYVLGYRASLAELGLSPGPLALGPSGGRLPRPDWAKVFDPRAAPSIQLEPVSELPAALSELRLLSVDGCPELIPESLMVPGGEALLRFLVALDANTALLGTSGGLFQVTTSSIVRIAPWGDPSLSYYGAYVPQLGGDLWLARSDGAVERGQFGRGFQEVDQVPGGVGLGDFVGPLDGDGSELASASREGLTWLHEGSWRGLPLVLDAAVRPRLAFAPNHKLSVLRRDAHSLYEVTGVPPVARDVDLGLSETDSVKSLMSVPGLGTVAGTARGLLYRHDGADWSLDRAVEATTGITVALPAFGGVLLGGQHFVLALWLDADRSCGSQGYAINDNRNIAYAVSIGGSVLLASEGLIGGPQPLVRLRSRSR